MHQPPAERRPGTARNIAAARLWHAEASALRDSARTANLNTTQQARLQREAALAERRAARRLWPERMS